MPDTWQELETVVGRVLTGTAMTWRSRRTPILCASLAAGGRGGHDDRAQATAAVEGLRQPGVADAGRADPGRRPPARSDHPARAWTAAEPVCGRLDGECDPADDHGDQRFRVDPTDRVPPQRRPR